MQYSVLECFRISSETLLDFFANLACMHFGFAEPLVEGKALYLYPEGHIQSKVHVIPCRCCAVVADSQHVACWHECLPVAN